MCNLCNNNQPDNYTHSRSRKHLKLLIQKFKKYKADEFRIFFPIRDNDI